MSKSWALLFIVASICMLQCCNLTDRPSPEFVIELRLKDTSQVILIARDTLYSQSPLRSIYQFSRNQLIWRQYTADPTRFEDLVKIIEGVIDDGLNPRDYHLDRIHEYQRLIKPYRTKNPNAVSDIVDIDFLLSDAFLTLAFHLYSGLAQGTEMNNNWECYFNEKNFSELILGAAAGDSINETLSALHPPYLQYRKLREWLKGNRGFPSSQSDYSLTEEQKIKIKLSMERWRWLPKSHDSIFLTVNIPAFQLQYHSGDSTLLRMKTIVGTLENPTPAFNCELAYLIINPRWNVPSAILQEEILPRVLTDTSYLSRNHFQILKTWQDNDTNYVKPDSIIWDSVTVEDFPYRIIQMAGFWNPLGDLKFMFPNQYEVYLHDTPNHSLFDHNVRTFSHGCIRVENAKDLAVFLTRNDSLRYPQFFQENHRVDLDTPIPIFINYWTAWFENGEMTFYDDIYHADSLLQIKREKVPFMF